MSYNQKVWLGVLAVCALFWLTLISGIYTYSKTNTHQHEQSLQEQAMRTTPAKHNAILAQAI